MPTVSVLLNGRSYDVACGVGEEDRVRELANKLRGRMEQLAKSVGAVPENLLFALTALLLADELDQRDKELAQLQAEQRSLADGREAQLANSLETLASKIEAIAARLQAA
ncbi:MAG TPA: cell division protein ZapA [Terriglobales bacterium]|jgi:cell division protein ZapA|nr:cell division protein ZapA [Terriglobales bacterium]